MGDVRLLAPQGAWTEGEVFRLLTDPGREEWRDKVGVAGRIDGSAKATTRLLLSRHWVCKTRIDQSFPSAEDAEAEVLRARAPGMRAGVWHHEKRWALVRRDARWFPVTLCPALRTLRRLHTLDDRVRAWSEMLQVGLDVQALHGIGLDLNPSNFAFEDSTSRMFYLDDETYRELDACICAGAIAARIPEEPEAPPEVWLAWGTSLRASVGAGAISWESIHDEIERYPIHERFQASRRALLEGISSAPVTRRLAAAVIHAGRGITCVLGDVHGNLPALEAVLADAREHGADAFLFLGDAVGYGPQPSECVRLLAELEGLSAVRGNHDHAMTTPRFETGMNAMARQCAEWTRTALCADEKAWLASLPTELREEGWTAVHGAPKDPHRFLAYVYDLTYDDNLRYLRSEKIPLCFYGHTHVQLIRVELAAGTSKLAGPRTVKLSPRSYWLVNPGSVGQPRDGDPRAAYALWDRRTDELTAMRVPYDVERTVEAIRAHHLPSALEQRLRVGS